MLPEHKILRQGSRWSSGWRRRPRQRQRRTTTNQQPTTSRTEPFKKNQHQIKLLNYTRSQKKKVNICFYEAKLFCLCFRRKIKLKTSMCNKSFIYDLSGLSSTYLQILLDGFALKSNHHKNEEVIEWRMSITRFANVRQDLEAIL